MLLQTPSIRIIQASNGFSVEVTRNPNEVPFDIEAMLDKFTNVKNKMMGEDWKNDMEADLEKLKKPTNELLIFKDLPELIEFLREELG